MANETPAVDKSLQDSILKLNQSIGELISIFKEASEQMKFEERETDIIAKKIDPLFEKIDVLIEQNQKIARGIVAVADMVTARPQPAERPVERPAQIERPAFQPQMPSAMPRTLPAPQAPRLPPVGEPGSFPPPPSLKSFGDLPPLMPPKKEKKSLFGFK